MSLTIACLAGRSAYRLIESGELAGEEMPRRHTPFGRSGPVFRIQNVPVTFYLMLRRAPGPGGLTADPRANIYALKDLGVSDVVNFSGAAAITHNLNVGQIVLPGDLMDLTRRRTATFFEGSGRGFLRQFPVFCPTLRHSLKDVLEEMGIGCRTHATVAVTDGPRPETPAEVRMLASFGAELVTHALAPEVFLARELQMCLAGVCQLVGYAESGSRHRPFTTGALFDGMAEDAQGRGVLRDAAMMADVLRRLCEKTASAERICQCQRSMAQQIDAEGLQQDWHKWFDAPGA